METLSSNDLANLILKSSKAIETQWLSEVRRQISKAATIPTEVLMNSLPSYLKEIANVLKNPKLGEALLESLTTARKHGETRVRLGYQVREVAAEYTILRETILLEALKQGELSSFTTAELSRIHDAGLVNAVEEFLVKTLVKVEHEALTVADFLHKHERKNFENLFERTPELVCILEGPEHIFRFVNAAHIKVLGFDATGLPVRTAQPESVEVHVVLDEVYRSGKTLESLEIPVTVTDRLRYFNLTYAARRNFEGQIDGIMILGMEVTEEVLNREALKLQSKALQLSTADAPLPEILDVLTRLVEMQTGYTLKASILLLSADKKSLVHGAAPSLPKAYNDAIHGIEIGLDRGSCGTAAFLKETTVVTDISSDHRWKDFRELAAAHDLGACWSVPILGSSGRLLGTFAFYSKDPREPTSREIEIVGVAAQTTALIIERRLEIEERIASAQEAERARDELHAFFIQAPAPMVIFTGPDHHFTLANPLYEKFVGRKVVGKNLADVFSPEEVDYYRSLLDSVYQTGEPHLGRNLPLTLWDEKGVSQDYWIDVSYTPFRNKEGAISGILVFVQDVTDSYQARLYAERHNLELSMAKAEAERANDAKSAFLANMSHEIRTPLGAIMGFADLAKQPDASPSDILDYLSVVERNSVQVLRIIDDILDLAKVEAGRVDLELMEITLKDFLADFASLIGFRARENGISFKILPETDLPSKIIADPTRLRQILTNAVGNAIKFTRKGHVILHVSFHDSLLEFGVEDTGRGISVEQIPKLFHAFAQADASTTRKFGGTGLGLILTKHLCKLMGGDYVLRSSNLGVGSLFVATIKVELPVGATLTSKREAIFNSFNLHDTVRPHSGLEELHILLVEDSPDNQVLIKRILEKQGATLDIASDGLSGVEKALSGSYDLILMDIQMPNMDGHEATSVLRAKGFQKPIIALTAHAMKEESDRAEQSGFTNFLTKPIHREHLISLVKEVTRH